MHIAATSRGSKRRRVATQVRRLVGNWFVVPIVLVIALPIWMGWWIMINHRPVNGEVPKCMESFFNWWLD